MGAHSFNMSGTALIPERIVLTGFMGSGKSTVGARLARSIGWDFVDLDEHIVGAAGKSIADIFETAGESSFRRLEHNALAQALERRSMVLAIGGGAMEAEANRTLLAAPGTLLVYLSAPLEVLAGRCRQQQIADPHAARRPVLEQRAELAERFLRRKPLYESAHWTIPTAECSADQVVRMILERWEGAYGLRL